jgi:hypothetical protein
LNDDSENNRLKSELAVNLFSSASLWFPFSFTCLWVCSFTCTFLPFAVNFSSWTVELATCTLKKYKWAVANQIKKKFLLKMQHIHLEYQY